MLLLHLRFDGLANVLGDHCLYAVWARGPRLAVTGALCRKTDPKIATAPKTQSRSRDQNKDKDNSE